jgi:molybdopterin molybdotransferase
VSAGWLDARAAASSFSPLPAHDCPLDQAVGLVLAQDVLARDDLPGFDTAAMDGWAVAGTAPWQVVGAVLAGETAQPVGPGEAVRIATGAALPAGALAVLRRERGREVDGRLATDRPPEPGTDVRRRGSECRSGDVVAEAGMTCTPAVLGLVAAAGADTLAVVRRARVRVLVLGDELVREGRPVTGRVRDALGPMLPAWFRSVAAAVGPVEHVADTEEALRDALAPRGGTGSADVVVTTGSTARGPVDHLHTVLEQLGAELLVDGVDVRPGHPMLLARLADGTPLVGLPGNPLAAVSGVVTLALPVIRALHGLPPGTPATVRLREAVVGHPVDVRLVPVRDGTPVHHVGPAMLRGLVHADALAVISPGGAATGDVVPALLLPGPAS